MIIVIAARAYWAHARRRAAGERILIHKPFTQSFPAGHKGGHMQGKLLYDRDIDKRGATMTLDTHGTDATRVE
jgi:hypothetical protein